MVNFALDAYNENPPEWQSISMRAAILATGLPDDVMRLRKELTKAVAQRDMLAKELAIVKVYILLAKETEAGSVEAIGPFETREEVYSYANGKGGVWRIVEVTKP